MKTLNTLITALIIVLSTSAFAADDVNNEKLKLTEAVNIYIDAVVSGKQQGLLSVIDNDLRYSVVTDGKVVNYTRNDLITSLEPTKNTKQNCGTTYEVLEHNLSQSVVKVSMRYELFTKVSLINLANTRTGWKITSISSTYQ